MISIIICSARAEMCLQLEKNISLTLGIPYEIIAVPNALGTMGICTAYNLGARKAKYSYLCFVHEDVEFISTNWGQQVIDFFIAHTDAGIAGLAGSKYKSKYISGWSSGKTALERTHLFHKFPDGAIVDFTSNPEDENNSEVIVLDGVCLFMPQKVWKEFPFNESLGGFHFYDIDISLRITHSGYKAFVLYFVDLIHFSAGKFDNSWIEKAIYFHKREDIQVLINHQLLQRPSTILDKEIKQYWIQRLARENISKLNRFRLIVLNYKMPVTFIRKVISVVKLRITS